MAAVLARSGALRRAALGIFPRVVAPSSIVPVIAVPVPAVSAVESPLASVVPARGISTHRRRRRKMNKHLYRKLRKRMRNVGGANQKKK